MNLSKKTLKNRKFFSLKIQLNKNYFTQTTKKIKINSRLLQLKIKIIFQK